MNLRHGSALVALMLLLVGCAGTAPEKPSPVPTTPPPTVEPAPSHPAPVQQWPNSIGAYREAVGEGLVLTGYTALDKVKVEVRAGGQTLRSQEVSSKDGGPGPWSFTMPAPEAKDVTVTLINPADGTILATGALSPEMFVGLFHSSTFTDTRVEAKAAERSTLRITGKVLSGERIRVEFMDPLGKLQKAETVAVTGGSFDARLPWPDGSSHLRFYTLGGQETPQLGLIIQIVAR